jgi:hypothetical protein
MGKPSAPPQPDYAGAATAQGQANIDAARSGAKLSNPNIYNPYGSRTVTYGSPGQFNQAGFDQATADYNNRMNSVESIYDQMPEIAKKTGGDNLRAQIRQQLINKYGSAPDRANFMNGDPDVATVNETLSPEEQQIFDLNQQNRQGLGSLANLGIGNVSDVLGSSFDPSSLPAQQVNPGQTAQDAIMARLAPQMDLRRQQNASELANQGIMPGSEAYNNAMRVSGQQENDLRSQAALQGISVGQQARQQALGEGLTLRQLPLNEITALMSGSQVNVPQFQGYSGTAVAPTPFFQGAQMQGQNAMDLYNQQAGMYNSQIGGLSNLGLGAAMYYSDRRLKKNIHKLGEWANGINLYSFTYFWGEDAIGLMAEEVEKVFPYAVSTLHGFQVINYGELLWADE